MTATITLSPAVESLIEFLGEVRPGANMIGFTARTAVKLNKKHRETKEPCPFKEVWKTSTVNAMIQCNYGAAMERRTDEVYVPGETWHEPVLDSKGRLTPCSRDPKTDKFYLRVQDPKTIKSVYVADGVPVEFDVLKPYLPPLPAEKPVVPFRVYGLQGIEEIKADGQTWTKPAFTFEVPE